MVRINVDHTCACALRCLLSDKTVLPGRRGIAKEYPSLTSDMMREAGPERSYLILLHIA